MVDLTPQPGNAVAQAPTSGVSPAQVAQPYSELARSLDETGGALNEIAKNAATQAGYQAVTRDADGNIQVEKAPLIGEASQAYARAVKIAALADGEGDAKRADIALRVKYRDDPEGYLAASEAFRQQTQDHYTAAAGPAVGIAVGRAIDTTTTYTFRGLLAEKERLDLARASNSIDAGIQSSRDDAVALARGGDTQSPAFQQAVDKIHTLTNEKVGNPRLAYPADKAQYDLDHLDGELKANSFLYHNEQIYKDTGVNPDGSPKGGAAAALQSARQILTDPSVKLTPTERQQYFQKAVGEIHANEALRHQDIREANAAGNALAMVSALGGSIEPEMVEQVASAHMAAGDPGGAARVYAMYARKPLNDDFGRQPLPQQTQQLQELRGMPRQQAAYQFFKDKGYTDAQASGIVGGLRGETASLDTTQVHDGGIGLGISGWNGPRLAALKSFAAANNASPTDLRTQLEFVNHELQTTEKASGDKLRAAQTPEDAANAMLGYFRPKDFDVPGAHPERALYARTAFNTFGNGVSSDANPFPDGIHPTPAANLWLQANRASTVQKTARASWAAVMADYDKTGTRPANGVIGQIVDAAHATNDHDLLEGIYAGTQRMDIAEREGQRSLPAQHADITELQSAGARGDLSVGQSAVQRDLERKNAAITKGLDENPISTAVANFPDKLSTPPPLNLQDPQAFAAGIAQRGRIAQFAKENWQSGPVSALDKADLAQIQGALDSPDPNVKAAIFQGLSVLPDDVRGATLKKIGEKRPDFMVSAAAGGLMKDAPDIAQSIFRGQSAIKADKGYLPEKNELTAFQTKLDDKLPASTFSLAARTDDSGPYAVAQGMVKARYADLSAQSGDTTGKLNEDRLTQSVNDVTGGVLHMNGGGFIAPARGMPQPTFDRLMYGVKDADMVGVSTINGQSVTADYLRQNAQLESVGMGRYFVKLGKDPMKPIYAYTGANSEMPQKFVLDLRNRPLGDMPAGQPGDIGNSP